MSKLKDSILQVLVKLALKFGLEIRRAGMGGAQIYTDLRQMLIARSAGVLHIGAHVGQEASTYATAGKKVLWVEAIPDVHKALVANLTPFSDQRSLNALLGDEEKLVTFHLAENRGESSSLFQFSKSSRFGVRMSGVLQLQMRRLDSILTPRDIRESYSHWVVDVQGAELLVLKGAGLLLNECISLDVEVSTYETYEGGAQLDQITKHLVEFGFIPVWKFNPNSHGNLLFIRACHSVMS